jgi:bidirectional [NiFe] hydrogenase diaphorase subunit
VRLGAGAFVCGEETALIASVQGGRGTPVPRPPYPAVAGLWRQPTLINNVETFANIAPIIRKGGDWFAGIGTSKSKGTKVFALAGRIVNSRSHRGANGYSPARCHLRHRWRDPDGRDLQGGADGRSVGRLPPEELLDMNLDYESLVAAGSIMGSGGMVVMDDTSCMVEVASYFMDFCREESCGKCVPCRVGTTQMYLLLTDHQGAATMDDLAQLEKLGDMVRSTSLCGLGPGCPQPECSRPCATSATSTSRTSRTGSARRGSALCQPSPVSTKEPVS